MDSRVLTILYYICVPVGMKRSTILLNHMLFPLFSRYLTEAQRTHTAESLCIESYIVAAREA